MTLMKKILALAVLSAVLISARAQEGGNKNAIKLNPLSLIFATGNVTYERAIGAQSSFQIGGFYSGFKLSDVKYSGFGITPEFRYYFAGHKQALNGVYVGPFVRYQNFTLKIEDDVDSKTTYSSFGGGAVLGWEKSWASGFVLDLFVGPSYNSGKFENEGDEDEFNVKAGIDGFGLRTGITLGFSF